MPKEPSPAFQFYPRDFIADGDQAALSLEEVGAYIRMLSHSWLKAGLPDDPDKIARMIHAEVDTVSVVLREHFERVECGDGWRWVNQRQEEERRRQAKFRRQQQLKGRASANRRATTVQPDPIHGLTTVQPEGNSAICNLLSASAERKTYTRVDDLPCFDGEAPSDADWLVESYPKWHREERHGAALVIVDKWEAKTAAKAIMEAFAGDRAHVELVGRRFLSSSNKKLDWCPQRTLKQFAHEASAVDAWLRESA